MKKLLCFFGFHEWAIDLVTSRWYLAFGERCVHCHRWNEKNVIRKETHHEKQVWQ